MGKEKTMLYDIFYTDGTMDSNIPLPKRPRKGTKSARNTNWDGHVCVSGPGGHWIKEGKS